MNIHKLKKRGGILHFLALALLLVIGTMSQVGCGTSRVAGVGSEAYVFYPAPPDVPRFQFLASFKSADDIGEKKRSTFADHVLGLEVQPEKNKIIKPYGVAIHEGKIYACDTELDSVPVLDLVNKRFSFMGAGRTGKVRKPIGIFIDTDGKKYVADTGWNRVLIFDENDQYYDALGDPEKMRPVDVLVDGDNVLICDFMDNEIEIWDKKTRKYKEALGESIGEKVAVARPISIAKDKDNNYYIMESHNFRVTVVDEEGHRLNSFGGVGDSWGQFARPKGIAVDGESRVYVVDSAFANVQVFDKEGQLLTFLGAGGDMPGGLILPSEVTIDYDNLDLFRKYVHPNYNLEFLVIISNAFGPRSITVYGFVTRKE